ncbi:YdaU family protein [Brucella ciceri]|uniref:YdaU family protein n=1 Tax=Brucella ciceri TaxID=391287 RepID=UPI001F1325BC|nr:YdaU family protein [Brucella ciceri]MCH6203420.1 YdaU family protein [Brucella ciceri]
MTKMPWVRFFPSDWLGGTRGMSAVETGIYITLIATMYERGEPIAEDHARLARLCGASNSAFRKALDTLIDEGKITRIEAGLWNDRVEKEQVYLSEKSEVGSRAANARWGKKHNKNNTASDADALQTQCQGNANQKPDTIYISTDVDIKETRTRDFTSEFESHFWPIYPNKVGKPVARTAFIKARAKADLETIMAGLRAYVSKTDDRAWCNPSTWLNQERWADAPAQVPRGHAPPGGQQPAMMADLTGALLRQMTDRQNDEPDSENRSTIETSYSGGNHGTSAPAFRLTAPEGRR